MQTACASPQVQTPFLCLRRCHWASQPLSARIGANPKWSGASNSDPGRIVGSNVSAIEATNDVLHKSHPARTFNTSEKSSYTKVYKSTNRTYTPEPTRPGLRMFKDVLDDCPTITIISCGLTSFFSKSDKNEELVQAGWRKAPASSGLYRKELQDLSLCRLHSDFKSGISVHVYWPLIPLILSAFS